MIRNFSRTLHEVFTEYSLTGYSHGSWREYWVDRWEKEIERYFNENWFLVPIVPREKQPFRYYAWTQKRLSLENALRLTSKDVNIAVVLGPSGLVALDYETHNLPSIILPYAERTYTAITPRGFHLYFKCEHEPESQIFERLNLKICGKPIGEIYEWRGDIQYCLIPLSVVKPKSGPPKVYEWINRKEILDFKIFIDEMLDNKTEKGD